MSRALEAEVRMKFVGHSVTGEPPLVGAQLWVHPNFCAVTCDTYAGDKQPRNGKSLHVKVCSLHDRSAQKYYRSLLNTVFLLGFPERLTNRRRLNDITLSCDIGTGIR